MTAVREPSVSQEPALWSLVGNTPLVKLNVVTEGIAATVLESTSPPLISANTPAPMTRNTARLMAVIPAR